MAVNANERKNFVKLDTTKLNALYKIAKEKGLNMTALNRSIGHTEGFLKQCEYNGYIKKSDVMLVNMIYDVDLELHDIPEQPKQATTILNVEELVSAVRGNNVISKHLEEQNVEIIGLLTDIKKQLQIINNMSYGKVVIDNEKNYPRTYKHYTGVKNEELQFGDKEKK